MHTLRKSAQLRCPLTTETSPPFRPASVTTLHAGDRESALARQSGASAGRCAVCLGRKDRPFSNDLEPLQILGVNNHGSRDSDCRMRAER